MIVLDTGGLLAALDGDQRHHAACAAAVAGARGPLLLSPFVLAELDYLIGREIGDPARLTLLDEVTRGVYRLEPVGASDLLRARELMTQYADLRIGLTDASVVVLAERYGVQDVLTLDERHFRALRTRDRRRLRLLPLDPPVA